MTLLDTHVLIWMDEGNPRLGNGALQRINAEFAGSSLAVSAITFWEISMPLQKQRLEMRLDMNVWRKKLLKNGIQEIPLDGAIAIRAGMLRDFHGDPADRLIVATALEFSATLTTAKDILDMATYPR